MKSLLIVLTLLTLPRAWPQGSQAQAGVSITVQQYMNVRFDGGVGGAKDFLLILGAPGEKFHRVEKGFTATANIPFTIQSHLFAVFPAERFWTVDVDDWLPGPQRALDAPAGVRRSTVAVAVNIPHGRMPVAGKVVLTIGAQ